MSEQLQVLFLEDDRDYTELVRSTLEKEGFHPNIRVVDNGADFAAILEKDTFDVILGDYQLATGNGMEALPAARRRAPYTPFLLLSGVDSERAAIETIKSGAADYILKSGINRLVPAVQRAVYEAQARKRADEQLKKAQAELAHTSRLAGMADVATSVLHNVSNVLNSLNVSANLVSDELKRSRIEGIARLAALMGQHSGDLAEFLTHDPKGRQVPEYLSQLAEYLKNEQTALLKEMTSIRTNIEHIKDIVAIQQNYAQVSGQSETVRVTDLVEDALRMNTGALMRHEVQVVREYGPNLPEVTLQKHKVLQILINLIRNAKYACDESGRSDRYMTLRVSEGDNCVRIAVIDNGVGIPAENLTKIFNHGFTTRNTGHGFGLHSSAQAAKDIGGVLLAHSDGVGQGATFTLELPLPSATRRE